MSRTLFITSRFPRKTIPTIQSFNHTVIASRAVYSTSRTTKREARRTARTPTITRNNPNLEQKLTAFLIRQRNNCPRISSPSPSPPHTMAFLLPGLRRGLLLTTPLILSAPLLTQYRHRQSIRCDGPDPLSKITRDLTGNYASEARTPIITESGAANPRAIRQVSMGSILGVFCGLGISVFSKPLAILIGLGVFVLQVRIELTGQKQRRRWDSGS
jgi:hypothetical protein